MTYVITTVAAQFFVLILTLITNKIAAVTLSINDYAIYGQIVLLSSLISAFCTSGLQNCVVSDNINTQSSLRVYALLALVVSVSLFICVKVGLVKQYLLVDINQYFPIVYLFFIPLLYQLFVYKQASVVNKKVKKQYIYFNTGNSFVICCILVVTLYFDLFYFTVAFLLIRPGFLGVLALSEYIREIDIINFFKIFKSNNETKLVIGFLFYGIISTASFFLYTVVVRFIISENYDIETVGYFYTAQRVFELLLGFSLTYYSSFYFKKISSIDSKALINKSVLTSCFYSLLIFSFIAFLLNFYSKEIILILFSEKQLLAVRFFIPLTVNMVIGALVYAIGFALVAKINKFLMSLFEVFYLGCFLLLSLLIDGESIVWIFPIIMLIKLLFNSFIFYRVFHGKE